MKWYEPFYTGDGIRRRAAHIRERLDAGKVSPDHFLITLAAGRDDYLDVISTNYLFQESVRRTLPPVVGIAKDKGEAMGIVVRITEECYRETGAADLKRWLLERGHITGV